MTPNTPTQNIMPQSSASESAADANLNLQIVDIPYVNAVRSGDGPGRDTLFILCEFEGEAFTMAINLKSETLDSIKTRVLAKRTQIDAAQQATELQATITKKHFLDELHRLTRRLEEKQAPATLMAPPAPPSLIALQSEMAEIMLLEPAHKRLIQSITLLPMAAFPAPSPLSAPAPAAALPNQPAGQPPVQQPVQPAVQLEVQPEGPNRNNLLRLSRRQRQAMGLEHSVPGEADGEGG